MKSVVLAFVLAVVSVPAFGQATYQFAAPDYPGVSNLCGDTPGPDCFPFTTSMNISGTFTTASPLPGLQASTTDITAAIIDYSFSDGVTTYSKADPNSVIRQFRVGTDVDGRVTVANSIILEHWRSGSAPHAVGNTVDMLNIRTDGTFYGAKNNLTCTIVIADTLENRPDVNICTGASVGGQASQASLDAPGIWVTLPPAPALTTTALGLLATFFAGLGFHFLRRRRFGEA